MICRFISCVSVYLSVQFNLLPIEEVKSMRPSHLVIFGLAGKKRKRKKKENKNKSLAHSCSGKPWEVLREKNSGGENLHPDRGWGGCSRPLQGKIHFITLIIIVRNGLTYSDVFVNGLSGPFCLKNENKMNSTVRIPASILWRRSPAKCSALLRVTWQSLVLVEVVKVGLSSQFNASRHLNSRRDSRYFPRASWLPGCHGRPSVLAGGLQGRVHHLAWEIRIKTLTMYWLAGLWRSGSDLFHV